MYTVLSDILEIVKGGSVRTVHWIFRLHSQATACLLIGFSIIVSTSQFFDKPITCMSNSKFDDGVSERFVNNYCWIHATYTLPRAYNTSTGWNFVHPGIDATKEEDVPVYHAYYQWVGFFLFLQGIMFYAPKYLWSIVEKHQIKALVCDLNQPLQEQNNSEFLWVKDPNRVRKAQIVDVGAGLQIFDEDDLLITIDTLQVKTKVVGKFQVYTNGQPESYVTVIREQLQVTGEILDSSNSTLADLRIEDKDGVIRAKIIQGQPIVDLKKSMNCVASQSLEDRKKNNDLEEVVRYMQGSLGQNQMLAWAYLGCEALNFINVVGQMFFTNKFLGDEFMTYGLQVIRFANTDQRYRTDPMVQIFPRVTKCSYRQYGPAGSVQLQDNLCILPINVMNEKIFIFLWFWFVVLAVITGILLLYRILLLFSRRLRYLSVAFGRTSRTTDNLKATIYKCNFGDFFVISALKDNLNPMNFDAVFELYSPN